MGVPEPDSPTLVYLLNHNECHIINLQQNSACFKNEWKSKYWAGLRIRGWGAAFHFFQMLFKLIQLLKMLRYTCFGTWHYIQPSWLVPIDPYTQLINLIPFERNGILQALLILVTANSIAYQGILLGRIVLKIAFNSPSILSLQFFGKCMAFQLKNWVHNTIFDDTLMGRLQKVKSISSKQNGVHQSKLVCIKALCHQ